MTRSVYIIGGAGTGKSTFMDALMDKVVLAYGPLIGVHQFPNAKGTVITLRGHELTTYDGPEGLYIGHIRDSYPGTDGLDRASSIVGRNWLENGGAEKYDFIIAEGATLSTRPFLSALDENTDLLVVHLWADPMITDLRFFQRSSTQDDGWVRNTVSRAENLLKFMIEERRSTAFSIDTGNPRQWDDALERCVQHVGSA